MVEKAWWQQLEVVGHIAPTARKQRNIEGAFSLLFFFKTQPGHGSSWKDMAYASPYLEKPSQEAWRLIFWAILIMSS